MGAKVWTVEELAEVARTAPGGDAAERAVGVLNGTLTPYQGARRGLFYNPRRNPELSKLEALNVILGGHGLENIVALGCVVQASYINMGDLYVSTFAVDGEGEIEMIDLASLRERCEARAAELVE